METSFELLKGNFPKDLSKLLLRTLWIFLLTVLIKILDLETLKINVSGIKNFPYYLKWVTLSNLLWIYVVILYAKYGWRKVELVKDQSDGYLESYTFYQGISRLLFIIISLFVLYEPYKAIINQTLDAIATSDRELAMNLINFALLPWVLIWITVTYFSFKRDDFWNRAIQLGKDPKLISKVREGIERTYQTIKAKYSQLDSKSKIILLVSTAAVLVMIVFFFDKMTKGPKQEETKFLPDTLQNSGRTTETVPERTNKRNVPLTSNFEKGDGFLAIAEQRNEYFDSAVAEFSKIPTNDSNYNVGQSRMSYSKGMIDLLKHDSVNALKNFKSVIESDKYYKSALEKIEGIKKPLPDNTSIKAQDIVTQWIESIGKKDLTTAWNLLSPSSKVRKKNPTIEIFSSNSAYGGIISTKINSVRTLSSVQGYTLIEANYDSDDPVNDPPNCRCNCYRQWLQRFTLNRQNNEWIILEVETVGNANCVTKSNSFKETEQGESIYRENKSKIITMEGINFQSNSYEIQSKYHEHLNRIVDILKKIDSIEVEILGYTDSYEESGDHDAQVELSEKRANTVKDFLIKSGINGNRIMVKGNGRNDPIDGNDSQNERYRNRRVEFKRLK